MRTLHHSPSEQAKEKVARTDAGLKKYLPLAALVAAAVASPALSQAQQSRQCSASVQTGDMGSFTTTTRSRARLINLPLLESNRYLQITLPSSYLAQVTSAAASKPEADRPGFVAEIIQRNISAAVGGIGSRRTFSFQCAPITAPADTAPAAPQNPPAPATTSTPQPAPAPSDSTTAPAQPPAPDTTAPQRRRVIQPGGPGASTQKPAEPAQAQAAEPLPLRRAGGSGTDKDPYTIEVPVSSSSAAGTELVKVVFPFVYSGERDNVKIYVSLRFIAAGGTLRTSKSQLVSRISSMTGSIMREALSAKGVNDAPTPKATTISSILEQARNGSPDVQKYAADS